MLAFGVVADPHFSREKQIYNRFPSLSKQKMQAAVQEWKRQNVSFIVCLGDLINAVGNLEEDTESAREISQILHSAGVQMCIRDSPTRAFKNPTHLSCIFDYMRILFAFFDA